MTEKVTWQFLFPPTDVASCKDALAGTNTAIRLILDRRVRGCATDEKSDSEALANLQARRNRLLQAIGKAQAA